MKNTQKLTMTIDEMRRFSELDQDERRDFLDTVDNLLNMPPEEAAAIDTSRRDRTLLSTVRRRIVRRSRNSLRRRRRQAAVPHEPALTAATGSPKVTLEGLAPFTLTFSSKVEDSVMQLLKHCMMMESSLEKFFSGISANPLYDELYRLGQIYLRLIDRYVGHIGICIKRRSWQCGPRTISIDWARHYPGRLDSVSTLTSGFHYI